MNIQLTEVLTDAMGQTGQAILRDIVAGERDPKALARHRNGRIKASEAQIVKALTGNWRDEHLFVLGQALAMYDDIGRHLVECDTKLQGLMTELGRTQIDLGKAPRQGSKLRQEFDLRQILADWAAGCVLRGRNDELSVRTRHSYLRLPAICRTAVDEPVGASQIRHAGLSCACYRALCELIGWILNSGLYLVC